MQSRILNHQTDRKQTLRSRFVRHFALAAPWQPVDLRSGFPDVFDQGQYGSCGPNAMVGAMMFDDGAQGNPVHMLSRFFLYYQTRVIEGDVADDTGVSNEDLVQAAQGGVCDESLWPYDDAHFAAPPTQDALDCAKSDALLLAVPLAQDIDTVMTALTARIPIVAGISVYDSFMTADVESSGVIPVPDTSSESLQGGHDIIICGADPSGDFAWLRNSWGPAWGQSGYAKIPLSKYLLDPNLADSLWAIKRVGPIIGA